MQNFQPPICCASPRNITPAPEHHIPIPPEPCPRVRPNNFPDMVASSGRNQGHSLRSTTPLQNTQRKRRNRAERFLALSSPLNAKATTSRMVASTASDSAWDNQREAAAGITVGRVRRVLGLWVSKVTAFWRGGLLPAISRPSVRQDNHQPTAASKTRPLTSSY